MSGSPLTGLGKTTVKGPAVPSARTVKLPVQEVPSSFGLMLTIDISAEAEKETAKSRKEKIILNWCIRFYLNLGQERQFQNRERGLG